MFESLCSGKDMSEGMMLQVTEAAPDPRTIKTHLPLSLLPPSLLETCKVVCVVRNPKDMLVSYFKHCQWTKLMDFRGSLEEFFQYFVNDNLTYGSYGLFLKEIWEKRHHPNLHIMHFEDMKGDISEEMKKLNSFLNTQLSEEKLANIAKRTSFSEMKTRMGTTGATAEQNEDMKGFFRKGSFWPPVVNYTAEVGSLFHLLHARKISHLLDTIYNFTEDRQCHPRNVKIRISHLLDTTLYSFTEDRQCHLRNIKIRSTAQQCKGSRHNNDGHRAEISGSRVVNTPGDWLGTTHPVTPMTGEVNDWKNHFSTEMIPQMEKWLQENVTRIGAGFKFA
ncbi:sulfotransferase 1A1-like [Scylla paramamosain]|uniref:sulfotransferase 1A1-like n=1 Tax=Scylla paramamosain TaxID=85552 RepID=UPI003082C3F7